MLHQIGKCELLQLINYVENANRKRLPKRVRVVAVAQACGEVEKRNNETQQNKTDKQTTSELDEPASLPERESKLNSNDCQPAQSQTALIGPGNKGSEFEVMTLMRD
jgi:hypothetical protein